MAVLRSVVSFLTGLSDFGKPYGEIQKKNSIILCIMGSCWFEGNGEKAGLNGISAGTRLDYAKGVIEGHGGLGKMVGPCPDCLF